MKTYIQNGHVFIVPAPSGGIAPGEGLIVGDIFGIAAYSAAEGDPLELATTGVYRLPKASGAVLAAGARVAWDNTARVINNTPGTGLFPVGVATTAAGSDITSVEVRLDGVEYAPLACPTARLLLT